MPPPICARKRAVFFRTACKDVGTDPRDHICIATESSKHTWWLGFVRVDLFSEAYNVSRRVVQWRAPVWKAMLLVWKWCPVVQTEVYLVKDPLPDWYTLSC